MIDDTGKRVKEAGPSTPVEILGLDSVPLAGEIFVCPDTDKEAKAFADTFIAYNKTKKIEETKSHVTLEDMFNQIEAGKLKELNLIIKADVQGSVEAVKESLTKLSNEEIVDIKLDNGTIRQVLVQLVNQMLFLHLRQMLSSSDLTYVLMHRQSQLQSMKA